jgi:heme-degrading monooxygenase HmoA
MIGRTWRCQVDPARMKEYEMFETQESLPTFLRQSGLVAVLFGRTQKECTAFSIWDDMQSIEALAKSETFIATVKKLESSGMLIGNQTVETMEITGGYLPAAMTERPRETLM